MAVFDTQEQLVNAVRQTQNHGFRRYDAYSPYPIEEAGEAMEIRHTGVAAICWIACLLGAASGFGLMTYNTVASFPLNVGGRPYFSWPAYVPITFELTVLFGGVCTFLSVLALNGLPRFHHPVFNVDEFQRRGSSDGFFLVIEAEDHLFSSTSTYEFLADLKPARIHEVPQ
jgi:hypothetical protein